MNDEFAASLNFPEVQSVEDLKKYINEYLEYQVEARKADAAREKLYDQILEKAAHALFLLSSRDSGKYAASADGDIICTAGCGYGAVSSDDRQDYG